MKTIIDIQPNLNNYAKFLTRNIDEAKDLISETNLNLLDKKDKLTDDLSKISITIMHNIFINQKRREKVYEEKKDLF